MANFDYLQHYGLEGMKWGVRRWQYPDGRFNEEGKERYFGSIVKKIKENDEKAKKNKDISERYRTKALLNKTPFYMRPVSELDNFLYRIYDNSSKGYNKKELKLKDKFINNLNKIKIDDEDTLNYRKLGDEYMKDIYNYMNELSKDNGRDKTYKNLLYDNNDNNDGNNKDNNNKNNNKNKLSNILNNIEKNIANDLKNNKEKNNSKTKNKDYDDIKKYVKEYMDEYMKQQSNKPYGYLN